MRPDSTSDLAVATSNTPVPRRRERVLARRAPIGLVAASTAAAVLFAIPFTYLVVRNLSADAALLSAVASRQTLDPNTADTFVAENLQRTLQPRV